MLASHKGPVAMATGSSLPENGPKNPEGHERSISKEACGDMVQHEKYYRGHMAGSLA